MNDAMNLYLHYELMVVLVMNDVEIVVILILLHFVVFFDYVLMNDVWMIYVNGNDCVLKMILVMNDELMMNDVNDVKVVLVMVMMEYYYYYYYCYSLYALMMNVFDLERIADF